MVLGYENDVPPALPPALMVVAVIAGGIGVYLGWYQARGESAWGLSGDALYLAAVAAFVVFGSSSGVGTWLHRRKRRAAAKKAQGGKVDLSDLPVFHDTVSDVSERHDEYRFGPPR